MTILHPVGRRQSHPTGILPPNPDSVTLDILQWYPRDNQGEMGSVEASGPTGGERQDSKCLSTACLSAERDPLASSDNSGSFTAPEGIRTPNLRFRRPMLYPIELQAPPDGDPAGIKSDCGAQSTYGGPRRQEACRKKHSQVGIVSVVASGSGPRCRCEGRQTATIGVFDRQGGPVYDDCRGPVNMRRGHGVAAVETVTLRFEMVDRRFWHGGGL